MSSGVKIHRSLDRREPKSYLKGAISPNKTSRRSRRTLPWTSFIGFLLEISLLGEEYISGASNTSREVGSSACRPHPYRRPRASRRCGSARWLSLYQAALTELEHAKMTGRVDAARIALSGIRFSGCVSVRTIQNRFVVTG